jgi:hypothetical protein
MLRGRNYWRYSIGSFIAWAIALLLVRVLRGRKNAQNTLLVFSGWCICWVSETIARYIYPPPKRWLSNHQE